MDRFIVLFINIKQEKFKYFIFFNLFFCPLLRIVA